jgi:predicted RNA-binding protein associated with RNAse of E/G family
MSYESQIEREEDHLVEQVNSGQITREQFNKEMRELQREYRAMAQENAERAYDDEMARW